MQHAVRDDRVEGRCGKRHVVGDLELHANRRRGPSVCVPRRVDVRARQIDADERRLRQRVRQPKEQRSRAAPDIEQPHRPIRRDMGNDDVAHAIRPLGGRRAGDAGELAASRRRFARAR